MSLTTIPSFAEITVPAKREDYLLYLQVIGMDTKNIIYSISYHITDYGYYWKNPDKRWKNPFSRGNYPMVFLWTRFPMKPPTMRGKIHPIILLCAPIPPNREVPSLKTIAFSALTTRQLEDYRRIFFLSSYK